MSLLSACCIEYYLFAGAGAPVQARIYGEHRIAR
jgi:hypothetical protein